MNDIAKLHTPNRRSSIEKARSELYWRAVIKIADMPRADVPHWQAMCQVVAYTFDVPYTNVSDDASKQRRMFKQLEQEIERNAKEA